MLDPEARADSGLEELGAGADDDDDFIVECSKGK